MLMLYAVLVGSGLATHIADGFEDAAAQETAKEVVETVAAAAAATETEGGGGGGFFGRVLLERRVFMGPADLGLQVNRVERPGTMRRAVRRFVRRARRQRIRRRRLHWHHWGLLLSPIALVPSRCHATSVRLGLLHKRCHHHLRVFLSL